MDALQSDLLTPPLPARSWADRLRSRRDLLTVLAVWGVSHVAYLTLYAVVTASAPGLVANGAVDPICRWDCGWYVDIARNGYDPVARYWGSGSAANWAFFPALPVLIAGLSRLTRLPEAWAAVAVAQCTFLMTLLLFHAYAAETFDRAFARFATLMLAAWPAALYMMLPLSEALYVPLSLAVLLAVRRRYWLTAGLLAAVLSGTRIVGVLIVLPMLWLAVRQFGWRALAGLRPGTERAVLALAAAGIGLGLFMLHQHAVIGDALAFKHIQVAWMREMDWPWLMVVRELNPLLVEPARLAINALYFAVVLGALALLPVLFRRGLHAELLLTVAVMALALSSGRLVSMPRILGALFPLVLAAALVADRPVRRAVALGLAVLAQAGLAIVWMLEGRLGVWSELAM